MGTQEEDKKNEICGGGKKGAKKLTNKEERDVYSNREQGGWRRQQIFLTTMDSLGIKAHLKETGQGKKVQKSLQNEITSQTVLSHPLRSNFLP